MGKYILGIIILVIIIFATVYFITPKDSQPVAINTSQEITTGPIRKGVPIGKIHQIDSEDGKVTIGTKGTDKIQPVVTLSKLDDFAYLKVSYDIKEDQTSTTDDTITWKSDNKDLYFKQPSGDTFEFDIKLLQKPSSNIFSYNIDTKNLDFFYQPPLTDEEKEKGNIRPENVEGSYAVYYKNGISGDFSNSGGKNYKTGKAFHIYRPKIEDASGKWIWGELSIDEEQKKLLVKVPQEFLESGTYPIIVDPTFGYTSQGASDTVLCGSSGDYKVAMRADNISGTLTNISAYIKNQNGSSNIQYQTEEYPDSSGKPGSAEAQSIPTLFNNPSYQLVTDSFNIYMSSGTHWVGVYGNKLGIDNCRVAYDTGGTSNYGAKTNDFFVWQNDDNRYSVYATYNTGPALVVAGPNSPETMANTGGIGSIAWANPDNAKASDNVYTTATSPGGGLTNTNYLKATNFGFNIPKNSTISGIVASFERKRESYFVANDNVVKIIKSDGSIGATNKSAGTAWLTSEGYVSFGGTTDLWGETWTYSDINNSNFGVVISPQINMAPDGNPAYIDHVRITVYYTPPPGVNYRGNINLRGNLNLR